MGVVGAWVDFIGLFDSRWPLWKSGSPQRREDRRGVFSLVIQSQEAIGSQTPCLRPTSAPQRAESFLFAPVEPEQIKKLPSRRPRCLCGENPNLDKSDPNYSIVNFRVKKSLMFSLSLNIITSIIDKKGTNSLLNCKY